METEVFTRQLTDSLSDDNYAAFQRWLASRPDAGRLIRGGAGLRKVRWSTAGRGKRGGLRVIYYWRVRASEILLLALYSKNERTDLSDAQLKRLATYVKGLA